MSEESIRQRYKYYRKEMLANLISEEGKMSEEERKVICKIIDEKESTSEDGSIIDGGIKDKIIIFTRWHIGFLFAAYAESFIFKSNPYGWHWLDGLVNYFLIAGGGFALTALLFVFFTKKYKDKFMSNSFRFSVFATIMLYIASWNYCRISYSC